MATERLTTPSAIVVVRIEWKEEGDWRVQVINNVISSHLIIVARGS